MRNWSKYTRRFVVAALALTIVAIINISSTMAWQFSNQQALNVASATQEWRIGAYIRFHLNGIGQVGGPYIAVPVVYDEADSLMRIVEGPEWNYVRNVIGNIYGYRNASPQPNHRDNEMKGLNAPRPWAEISWGEHPFWEEGHPEASWNWAGAFWGWFEQEDLDPRTNGRYAPGSRFHIPLTLIPVDCDEECLVCEGDGGCEEEVTTRWRPSLGTTLREVHPGNAVTGGPLMAYGEANGIYLDDLLTNGFAVERFDDGPIDFFGIWIRWGDVDDDGITYSDDADLLHMYLNNLYLRLFGIDLGDMPPLHHGAARVTLGEYTYSDDAALLHLFLNDLYLILGDLGFLVPNPTRLGTAYPH